MMSSMKRPIGLATIALAWTLVACERTPTSSDDVAVQEVSLNADPRTPRTGAEAPQPDALGQLLQQAFRTAFEEGGEAAVRALHAQLAPFQEAVRTAKQSGDRAAVQRALAALRAEQINIVVRILGAAAPRTVLESGARLLADAATKIQAAKAAGRDVTRLEALLRQVTQLHTDAAAALQAGNLASALDLALQALDGARRLHRVLGR